MDKTLKTLHLRLDSTSRSLTKNAISQLIIKVLFTSDLPLTIKEIGNGIKDVLKTAIAPNRIEEGIEKLLEKEEIIYAKKKYSLSRSNRRTLNKRYEDSTERLDRLVETYFTPFHSDKALVIDWFSDATIEFFKSYSKEWISDICHKKSEKVKEKSSDIFLHIKRRTFNNKDLDKKDYAVLVERFVDCIINKKDADLDAHLWEYGTSAFAANLLQSSIGADPISIAAFRDSKCVLDTNVLMNIGLEASEYHNTIKKLDGIFSQLNVTPGYFHITEQEYINTVSNLNKEILRNVEKFDYSVIKETDDHFIQSAIKRECSNYEDFQTFCQQISTPPEYIESKKKIEIFNDDPKLDIAIENAQNDENKKTELNTIYKNVTRKDKRDAPLVHDVGIIAGIEYYRNTEKAFILSQEISVNKYSHTKPTVENLPLAIRLDTIISMLAIDNGGTDVNPTDFSNLFADMIRFNLQPDKNTFKITDLSKLLDTELQIEQLPAEEVVKIANSLHGNISKGLSDDEISLELNREFQEVKLKFVDDLAEAKDSLSFEKSEKERLKRQEAKSANVIKGLYRKEEVEKVDKYIKRSRLIFFGGLPIGISLLSCLGVYLYQNDSELSNFLSYWIALAVNVIVWLLTSVFISKPMIARKSAKQMLEIEEIVERRYEEGIK
ncbi:hypothetical protein [Carboxylicivirga marina]|uniref:Uncharacterized protein n=1 Tax=Carboxylicivirga marina TaxID=2800988 RepID=A0ABS1HIB8_9BACT|nr:hypothetical protein [Carboxylicivirga marina]MBK3517336.1 hypothetical protein [Carboxylicivirga marina]